MGALDNSITKGKGNLAGLIGEYLVLKVLGKGEIINTYDYDITYPIYDPFSDPIRIDVKTKRCFEPPRPNYECSIAAFNTTQECDVYAFTRVRTDNSEGWVLGYLKKEDFFENATFHQAGEIDPSNDFTFHVDCYNVRIYQLRRFKNDTL